MTGVVDERVAAIPISISIPYRISRVLGRTLYAYCLYAVDRVRRSHSTRLVCTQNVPNRRSSVAKSWRDAERQARESTHTIDSWEMTNSILIHLCSARDAQPGKAPVPNDIGSTTHSHRRQTRLCMSLDRSALLWGTDSISLNLTCVRQRSRAVGQPLPKQAHGTPHEQAHVHEKASTKCGRHGLGELHELHELRHVPAR